MTGRTNAPIAQRDLKPENIVRRDLKPAITWTPERDDRRLQRVAAILLDILDNPSTPEEGRKP